MTKHSLFLPRQRRILHRLGRLALGVSLFWMMAVQLRAAPSLTPEQLMILVIGNSAQRSDPDQQAVIDYLQMLRQDPRLSKLKMGTMHFDQPREAEFATGVLGVQPDQTPCLCLVQLDPSLQVPTRTLYSIPRVTRQSLHQVEEMAHQWTITAGLRPADPPSPSPSSSPGVTPSPVEDKNHIQGGESVLVGKQLMSTNQEYVVRFQTDGNLVIYRMLPQGHPIWASNTVAPGGDCTLGTDGILRISDRNGQLLWKSRESGTFDRYQLQIQDDGNLVIVRLSGGVKIWSSNTAGRL